MKIDSLFALDEFAQWFIADKSHHEEVRTEQLVEALRKWFDLPPFPSLADLHELCRRLGVPVAALSLLESGLPGVNTWVEDAGHQIFIDPSIPTAFAETTLGHELREVLEQAFCRAKPTYAGLATNSPEMHSRSERFAGTLLMPTEPSRKRLRSLGYDFVRFARETGRSLSSVVVQAQELFAARHGEGYFGGVWLFQLPWRRTAPAIVSAAELRVANRAHLRGFSLRKSSVGASPVLRSALPHKNSTAADFEATVAALRRGCGTVSHLNGLDLFGDHNFIVVAEPSRTNAGVPWRVLMCAIRRDFIPLVEPWLRRLQPVDLTTGTALGVERLSSRPRPPSLRLSAPQDA